MSALPILVDLPAVSLPAEPLGERLLTGMGMALDMTVVRAMRVVVNAALMPQPADVQALLASAAPYLDPELQADPRRFFAFMDEPPPVPQPTGRYRKTIAGGVVIRRRFRSEYRPFCEAAMGDMPPAPENDIIPVEHWTHEPARPAATVVALHGFSMGEPWLDAFALFASHWFRAASTWRWSPCPTTAHARRSRRASRASCSPPRTSAASTKRCGRRCTTCDMVLGLAATAAAMHPSACSA